MYKNFNKQDIINHLSYKTGYSINLSKKLINDFIDIIIINIRDGNLNLKNIGSYKLIHKNERIGRNQKTKDEFIISSRKSIRFKT